MSRSDRWARAGALLGLGLALGLGGCKLVTPPCEASCRKVVRCDLYEGLTLQECTLSCQRQEALYEDWEDEAKLDALHEHRRCLALSSCEEIAEDVCYDPEIFDF